MVGARKSWIWRTMISNMFTSSSSDHERNTFKNEQKTSEDSFQTKKELYSIYLQEARLRRELEFPIDDEKPNPFRTYQRLEHELAERRKFFSFNGQPTTRCKSFPSICYPGHTTQKHHSPTTSKGETVIPECTSSIKEPLYRTRAASNPEQWAQTFPTFSEAKVASRGFRKLSSCSGDYGTRQAKNHTVIRRTKSETQRRSQQQWKVKMHRRAPTII